MKKQHNPDHCQLKELPANKDPRMWLYAVLGPEQFLEFQKQFGGKRMMIPKYPAPVPCSYCDTRTDCIDTFRKKGESAMEISKKMGISVKRVYALQRSCPHA